MAAGPHASTSDARANAVEPPSGAGRILWVLWATYGAFYFCRTNIAAAVPGMKAPLAEGGLGLDAQQVGLILGGLKLAYGLGQLVNGQLAERISPRRLLALGMLGSALLNVLFGFGTGLYFLLFVWACNGYSQAFGWTPCVRVLANWVPALGRGRAVGILGTSYQVTASATYIVSGLVAEHLGWRAVFWVSAAILASAAVHMLLFLRESPRDVRDEPTEQRSAQPAGPWLENLRLTVANPALWLLALALFLLDACRYGFQDWGLTHLKEIQETGVDEAAIKYAILPFGGAVGAYLSGWLTDRFFGGRRAPVICGLLILLGVLTLLYDVVAQSSDTGTLVLLPVIGFTIFGPQVLLVGTAPADLARRGTAAAAAGFVNFMGYLGAFTGDWVTGYLVHHYNWSAVITAWAAWAFAGALVVALLWNARSSE